MLSLEPSLDIDSFVRASVSECDDRVSENFLRNGAYEVAGRGDIDKVFLCGSFGRKGWGGVIYDVSAATVVIVAPASG